MDLYTFFTAKNANGALLGSTLGVLDAEGRASAQINIPSGLDASFIGLHLDHAALVMKTTGIPGVTNVTTPVGLDLVP